MPFHLYKSSLNLVSSVIMPEKENSVRLSSKMIVVELSINCVCFSGMGPVVSFLFASSEL